MAIGARSRDGANTWRIASWLTGVWAWGWVLAVFTPFPWANNGVMWMCMVVGAAMSINEGVAYLRGDVGDGPGSRRGPQRRTTDVQFIDAEGNPAHGVMVVNHLQRPDREKNEPKGVHGWVLFETPRALGHFLLTQGWRMIAKSTGRGPYRHTPPEDQPTIMRRRDPRPFMFRR